MAFDYKKEYKNLYAAATCPQIITVPPANYIAVRGQGDPNEKDSEYQYALRILYAISYAIKKHAKAGDKMEGSFDYVVPPLEGFWWQDGTAGADYSNKASFRWISVIRLPDFVKKPDFDAAAAEVSQKKKIDCTKAEFCTIDEGECVQILHKGAFEEEPESIAKMDMFLSENGYENDICESRLHHEIYLSDARKTAPEKWRTIIRHPVRKKVAPV